MNVLKTQSIKWFFFSFWTPFFTFILKLISILSLANNSIGVQEIKLQSLNTQSNIIQWLIYRPPFRDMHLKLCNKCIFILPVSLLNEWTNYFTFFPFFSHLVLPQSLIIVGDRFTFSDWCWSPLRCTVRLV